MKKQNKPLSLYVHFPFCASKCTYCDFTSYSGMESFIPEYIDAMIAEIEDGYKKLGKRQIDTVYFGGGTPSYIKTKYLRKVVQKILSLFDCSKCKEMTIEVNPGTINKEKAVQYKKIGFDRISMGVQSVNNCNLKKAGRIHTYEDFIYCYDAVRTAGFDNVSCDLIFGFPWQSFDEWKNSVDSIIKLQPEHISCYSLKVEVNTPLYNQIKKGVYKNMSDVLNREMYYYACEKLHKNNYIHYEISNFSKPGYQSKHNTVYWKMNEYLGIGAGAHSYIKRVRTGNNTDIETYIKNSHCIDECTELSYEDIMNEYVMLGFRMTEGINKCEFKKKFGCDFTDRYKDVLNKLIDKNLIKNQQTKVKLTKKGLDFANLVFMEFI